MTSKRFVNTGSISWIVTILAFVLLYAAYFFMYIPQQESLVEKRGFRILKEYAGNMHDKYAYYKTHIKNYSAYYSVEYLTSSELLPRETRNKIRTAIDDNQQIAKLIENLEKTITTDTSTKRNVAKQLITNFGNELDEIIIPGESSSDVVRVLTRLDPGFSNESGTLDTSCCAAIRTIKKYHFQTITRWGDKK